MLIQLSVCLWAVEPETPTLQDVKLMQQTVMTHAFEQVSSMVDEDALGG